MMLLRRMLSASILASTLLLGGCMPAAIDGMDFSIRSDDGWVGLPIRELLLRPTLEAELLAVCFNATCPEPAALLTLRASGKDARELMASFNDPKSLAALLNKRDSEDIGKTRQAIKTSAAAQGFTVAGLPAFKLALTRPDRPDVAMHAVAVARSLPDAVVIVLAIAERPEVALANAEAAAGELLR